ncbi:hypothetical protein D3C81_1755180 [compost metagenome]
MGGIFFVVIAQRVPVRIKMFVNAVITFAGNVMNNHRSDTQRAVEPLTVVGDVVHNQERFHGMHIGVTATVIFGGTEGFIPGLQTHLFLLAPEILLNHFDCIIQQFACVGMASGDSAGCAE